ncbi:NAD-dependent epimerase/dehydratase family protein [Neptuniibacter sp. PT8_73]|uniref:NAD-dependent epimerase/dehydratase family protein n=1 Tax=Neptuniibacter sp. PT8_73 TaxID=3398206 RepID=UPI0039F5D57B
MNVLITGSTGFLGKNLASYLISKEQYSLFTCNRTHQDLNGVVENFIIDSIDGKTNYTEILPNIDVVIHAAAVVHGKGNGNSNYTDDELIDVNVNGIINLARQCIKNKVKRLIFISSIGVNGISSTRPFVSADRPNPSSLYAESKMRAEDELSKVVEGTNLELVLIRPPMIYGADAPGNFNTLVNCVKKGLPLPLGAVHNQRTFVGISNLVDFINVCIKHPNAAGKVLLVGDGTDVSTTEFIKKIILHSKTKSILVPVPVGLMGLILDLIGKNDLNQKLLGDLQINISESCDLLDWQPPFSVDECMSQAFLGVQ